MRPRRHAWLFALAAGFPILLSGLTLTYLGRRELITYDAYWHIFVARQDVWSRFWFEVGDNAHPPLFYLVLKAAALLGYDPLMYRAVSIGAIVVAAALLCGIARRLVENPWLAAVGTLAFALSYSAVNVGLEVRAYALATCLTLAAFYSYALLAETAFAAPMPRERILFALFTSLALLAHYSAIFVMLGALGAPVVLAALDREFRRRIVAATKTAWLANLVTFCAPLGVCGLVYIAHVRHWAARLNHVPEFVFNPARESLVAFLARTSRAQLELYSPIGPVDDLPGATFLGIVAVSVLFAIWACRLQAARRPVSLLPPVMVAIMGGLTLAGAVAGRYPFGGYLRHQFFVFPFVVLSVVMVLDWIDHALPKTWMRRTLIAGAFAGCIANIAAWMLAFTVSPGFLAQRQMDIFRSAFPTPQVVLVDQFNLITFFTHHHDWQWRLERNAAPPGLIQVWKVSKGSREIHLCREHSWILDLSDPSLYRELRKCLRVTGASEIAVFRPNQDGFPPAWRIGETSSLVDVLAAQAGLRPLSLLIDGNDVFASFAPTDRSRERSH